MNKDKLCLEIKEAEESQLSFLVTQFSPGNPMFQYNRYANPEAKRLYEKLGYVDWGHGDFLISWEQIDENGSKGIGTEVVIYMQKSLID